MSEVISYLLPLVVCCIIGKPLPQEAAEHLQCRLDE